MTTQNEAQLSEATLRAALGRAVPAASRQGGQLVSGPGISEDEEQIRLEAANWDESDARQRMDAAVASGAYSRADADAYLEYQIKRAAWCKHVVELLDAERADRSRETPVG